jgi:4-aminobutyrate aminotransferase-like enzyme
MSDGRSQFHTAGTKSQELLARRQEFVARGLASTMSVFAAKADGAIIEDVDGNRFIDFAGGIGTMNVGHCRPEVTKAIVEQAEKFTHTCFSVMMYESYITLAERIITSSLAIFPKRLSSLTAALKPSRMQSKLRAMPQDDLVLSRSIMHTMVGH